MKNRIHITTDGINIYSTLHVHASKVGIWLLSLFICIEITLFIFGLFNLEELSFIDIFFPLIIAVAIFLGLPIAYLVWNIYGKEEIIINTKSVSWSYNYGFIKTNLNTVKFDRLATRYERIRDENEKELGRLIFYNYRNEDNLPEVIHQTTVLVTKEDIVKLDQ